MWCYQRPGFEAHLLTELQRQQQCSQFCDTWLKAEGVSVPAHSCILSAVSPHISSALSSTPAPPAGQSRLLEFHALGACTLLHMVSLLYSGEMAGEGESEKQQAIYAASKLGINELMEVTNRKSRGGGGEMSQYVEVGVQTEENEATHSRWRREVRDGSTYLWKETLSDGGKDMWTQTEEINVFPSAQPVASYETIDLGAFQSINQTDSHQFVPITVIYPPNENQTIQVSSDASNCIQESAGSTSVAVVEQPHPSVPAPLPYHSTQTEPQSHWAAPQEGHVTVAEAWEKEQIEQFEGNIAEFLTNFLNSESNRGTCRGRAARRQRGRQRSGGEGQQRARRPRRPAGMGRGKFTQMVDVQEVGVGKLQKLFLDRWRVRTPRTGQGGGAIGRKLYLKTRDVKQPARRYQRSRGRGKVLEVSQSQDVMLRGERRRGITQQGPKNTPKQFKQFNSVSCASGSSLHPSLSLLSPAASYVSPASSLLHTTHLPNPAPPLYDVQSEPIDHLLEDVMMGLDILPNNSSKAAHSRCRRPAGSLIFSSPDNVQAQDRQQVQTTEVELTEILENLLQSFEQHVESCSTTQEDERADGSSSENQIVQSKPKRARTQTGSAHTSHLHHKGTPRQVSRSEKPSQKASDRRAAFSKPYEKTQKETKSRRANRKTSKQGQFSLEKKAKKSVSSSEKKSAVVSHPNNKQLQQIPVVRLDRNTVMLQGKSSSILEDQSPSKAKSWVSSVKSCFDNISRKNLQENWQTKCYPIRSRFRQGQFTSVTFLEEPLSQRPGKLRKNKQLPSSAVQPQPVDSSHTDDQSEGERNGDSTVLPQEEAPAGTGQKRRAQSDEETNEDAPLNKRIRLDKTTCETSTPRSEASDFLPAAATIEQEAVMDVETVSLSLKECFQETKPEEELGEHLKSKEMSSDEGEGLRLEQEQNHPSPEDRSVSPPLPDKEIGVARTGKAAEDVDEDVIDVTGGSSPVPDPVTIIWTESSEDETGDEDKEIDVVGEKMDRLHFFYHSCE